MERTTSRTPWIAGFLALLAFLVGCALHSPARVRPLPAAPRVPASSIQPPPRFTPVGEKPPAPVVGGPRFNHVLHADMGVGCADCHEIQDDGSMSRAQFDMCWMCHEDLEEDAEPRMKILGVFWSDAEDPKPLWEPALREYDDDVLWSHAPHEALECAACHGDMTTPPEGRRARQLFTMAECSDCHQEQGAPNECSTCHERLDTDVPPASHAAPAFLRTHGPVSRTQRHLATQNDCSMCHSEPQDCNSCHQEMKPASHQVGWTREHAQRVLHGGRAELSNCVFCHNNVSWCDSCHDRVPPLSHRHQWEQRHGKLVRAAGANDLARCQYCHEDPSFCDRCHQDELPRDHTNLFRIRTHGVEASIDRTRCMVCHETDFCIRCHQDTPPLSHRGMFARGRNTHCVQCHFPLSQQDGCRACHFENPTHDTAPPQPPTHGPGLNCRACHNSVGGGGAPPLRHVDNGMNCEFCHR